jgi:hypothetical protein
MPECTVKILLMDEKITKLMHGFDMFEHFKVVVLEKVIIATYKKAFTKKNLSILKEYLEKLGYPPIVIFNQKNIYYQDHMVKEISNGKHYVVLNDFIKYHIINWDTKKGKCINNFSQ